MVEKLLVLKLVLGILATLATLWLTYIRIAKEKNAAVNRRS
jgi:hypothetical protein